MDWIINERKQRTEPKSNIPYSTPQWILEGAVFLRVYTTEESNIHRPRRRVIPIVGEERRDNKLEGRRVFRYHRITISYLRRAPIRMIVIVVINRIANVAGSYWSIRSQQRTHHLIQLVVGSRIDEMGIVVIVIAISETVIGVCTSI